MIARAAKPCATNRILLTAMLCFSTVAYAETIDIDTVWAGHPVGFCLLTHEGQQFAAYYNAERQMTIAQRDLDSDEWTYTHLDSYVKWDSHNSITMTVDDDGYLHLAGNMHNVPLIYFRTAKPGDASTFTRIPNMTGEHEERCTYPRFFRGPSNELIFTYRDGSSGNGVNYYNVYDHATQTWSALIDKPLLDGEGKMNAYQSGPSPGPDGYFHMVWVWRDTPDCATNHSPSYARSKDLVRWENAAGEPMELPIRIGSGAVVDPVGPGGGVINGNIRFGFDSDNRIIVSYHKYDEDGNIQIYNARFKDGDWKIQKTTNWDYRWEFSGNGSIGTFKIGLSGVSVEGDDLIQSYRCPIEIGTWRLDPETLKPIERYEATGKQWIGERRKLESGFEGMNVKRASDIGDSGDPNIRYELSWETLPANRDRPREKPWPEPSVLRLHTFTAE